MGREYVIDHCMTALEQKKKNRAYMEYVGDCLRFASHNTAVLASAITDGKADVSYMSKSFRELMEIIQKPQDNRTAEEIISDFLNDFGGKEEPGERI